MVTAHTGTRASCPIPGAHPGSIDPVVTQANIRSTICKGGWTEPHLRPPVSQTDPFKYDVAYPAYGTPQSEKTELDHLVPLELGGSNDATNLWPEYPASPNPKDKVENALNAAVCDGRVSLAAAQQAIAFDWMTAEKRFGIGPVVSGGSAPASTKPLCTATAAPANDGYSGDYNVSVKSNEPDRTPLPLTRGTRGRTTPIARARPPSSFITPRLARQSGSRSAGRHARRPRSASSSARSQGIVLVAVWLMLLEICARSTPAMMPKMIARSTLMPTTYAMN